MPRSRTVLRVVLLAGVWCSMLLSAVGHAEDPPDLAPDEVNPRAQSGPNIIGVQLGGQIEVAQYRNGFQLGANYQRWLKHGLWLDVGTTLVVHKNTNWGLNGGVRWRFMRTRSGIEGFIKALAEVAVLSEEKTQVVIGTRVGGGAAYYATPGFGATLEGNISVGPSFGAGSNVASSVEVLAGVEFPF